MFIVLAYRKGSNFQIVDRVIGPFSSRHTASNWAFNHLPSDPATDALIEHEIVVYHMQAPI